MSEQTLLPEPVCDASFQSQFARIFEAAECRTQSALAELFDIKQSSVSDAKRRKSIPSDWLVKLYEKKRVNPDWSRTGLGNKILQIIEDGKVEAPEVINIIERRSAQECTTDELMTEIVRRSLKNIG